jgi:hypothetical protein
MVYLMFMIYFEKHYLNKKNQNHECISNDLDKMCIELEII